MPFPYLGEIRMFAGNFPPVGWMFCEGQLLPISENDALFNLIGTTYGGDGESTFALPDLRGRIPIHQGNGFILAETGGAEEITLTVNQIPSHTHVLNGSSANGGTNSPNGALLASFNNGYSAPSALSSLNPGEITNVGGSQAHLNMQPFLTLTFAIALQGIFPSPN